MTKYGLRHISTQTLLAIHILAHNDDESPIDKSYSLELQDKNSSDSLWLVDTKEQSDFVRRNSQHHISSSYISPEHNFKPSELEVVELQMNVQAVSVTPYTYENFCQDLIEEEKKYGANATIMTERSLKEYLKDKEKHGGETDALLKKWAIPHYRTKFDENKIRLAELEKSKK